MSNIYLYIPDYYSFFLNHYYKLLEWMGIVQISPSKRFNENHELCDLVTAHWYDGFKNLHSKCIQIILFSVVHIWIYWIVGSQCFVVKLHVNWNCGSYYFLFIRLFVCLFLMQQFYIHDLIFHPGFSRCPLYLRHSSSGCLTSSSVALGKIHFNITRKIEVACWCTRD